MVKNMSTRRAALSTVAVAAVLAMSADLAMAENASSRSMLRQSSTSERKLSGWSSLMGLLHPPGPPHPSHSSGSSSSGSSGSSGSPSSGSSGSSTSTSNNNHTNNPGGTWGKFKCWAGFTEKCQSEAVGTGINNNAQGGDENVVDIYGDGGGGANGAGAGSGASSWGIIGMAVGGVVLVAAVAGFLIGRRRSEEDEDGLGGATRSSALLTKPGEDLESVDGTLATGDPTIASGSTGATMATMIEMTKRTNAEATDEEAGGGYINMDKLTENKGLVPELDYTESEEGDSELMGMDYVDFDEVATGLPVSGEGGPMWAAAAAAAATAGAAANPTLMSDEETEEISHASSQTSETQESVASSVGYRPASVTDRVAAIEETNTYLVPMETEPVADIEAEPSAEEEVEELDAEEPEAMAQAEPIAEEPEAMAEEPEAEAPETEEAPLAEEPEAEAMADEDSVDADSDTASTTSSSTAQSF